MFFSLFMDKAIFGHPGNVLSWGLSVICAFIERIVCQVPEI